MKKLLLLMISAMGISGSHALAQLPFSVKDSININNINARVMVHGDMWWDPESGTAKCSFPPLSGKNINFAGALWMSGYDAAGQLHIAAQTYRQDGNDYWPGPLDAADTLTYATSQKWAKIWKVNRSDINTYLTLGTHTIANTPAPILSWPAKGNANAAGAGGAPLTISTDMAPFVDVNGNGIYEPLSGDYPNIKGDQALWWVFSDNGPSHTNSHGRPLGVEIQAMAYGYSRGTLIDNVVYYDYKIVNRSTNTYSNFRLGEWDDADLGYYLDDYIGFDSVHRMGITYNGNNDDGAPVGHPEGSYDTMIPIVGLSMLILPGDDMATNTRMPAGSFMYYNNDASPYGNPLTDIEYNNYLRARFKGGAHLTNDFMGPGINTAGYGSGNECNYVFPGDPAINTQWSECSSTNLPGDRRFIITSNDFTLPAGGSQRVVMALMATKPDTGNGCPGRGFGNLKNLADTAWHIFDSPLPAAAIESSGNTGDNYVSIYPNPAHDKLYIKDNSNNRSGASLAVYNSMGQLMNVTLDASAGVADISNMPAGIYYTIYRNSVLQRSAVITKE